jgi:hypothetical protein
MDHKIDENLPHFEFYLPKKIITAMKGSQEKLAGF